VKIEGGSSKSYEGYVDSSKEALNKLREMMKKNLGIYITVVSDNQKDEFYVCKDGDKWFTGPFIDNIEIDVSDIQRTIGKPKFLSEKWDREEEKMDERKKKRRKPNNFTNYSEDRQVGSSHQSPEQRKKDDEEWLEKLEKELMETGAGIYGDSVMQNKGWKWITNIPTDMTDLYMEYYREKFPRVVVYGKAYGKGKRVVPDTVAIYAKGKAKKGFPKFYDWLKENGKEEEFDIRFRDSFKKIYRKWSRKTKHEKTEHEKDLDKEDKD